MNEGNWSAQDILVPPLTATRKYRGKAAMRACSSTKMCLIKWICQEWERWPGDQMRVLRAKLQSRYGHMIELLGMLRWYIALDELGITGRSKAELPQENGERLARIHSLNTGVAAID